MSSTAQLRKRVYLYIIRGNDLLVLRHVDFPELGLQIPGGTVEPNEAPIVAAAREAFEETGLAELGSPKLLGVNVVNSERAKEKLLEAWYYRIQAVGQVSDKWQHTEQFASGGIGKVHFELSWIAVSRAFELLSATDCLMLDGSD